MEKQIIEAKDINNLNLNNLDSFFFLVKSSKANDQEEQLQDDVLNFFKSQIDEKNVSEQIIRFGQDNNITDVLMEYISQNLFVTKKIILIRDMPFSPSKPDDLQTLRKLLSLNNRDTYVVFFDESNNYAAVEGKAHYIDVKKLDDDSVIEYLRNYVVKNGYRMDDDVILTLFEKVNKSLMMAKVELDKIFAYNYDNKIITFDDLDEVTANSMEYKNYMLANAIANKEHDVALHIVTQSLNKGVDDGSLFSAIKALYARMKDIKMSPLSNDELSLSLKIKPYAVQMTRKSTNKYSQMLLNKIVQKLEDIDLARRTYVVTDATALQLAICYLMSV